MHRLSFAALICVMLVAGCYPEPVALRTLPPTAVPRVTILHTAVLTQPATPTPRSSRSPLDTFSPIPLATPSASPGPVPDGSPSAGCVNGWTSPTPDTVAYEEGIDIVGGTMGSDGPWNVTEMRYFTGPDSPGVIEPRFDVVERWYVKASLADDPAFRGRWLIEKRTDQILGVAAVAPWDTSEYASPEWTSFIGEGPPQTYIGLPGQWRGIPFDFVTGEGDGGQPGLPSEVVGCLQGV